MHAQFNIVESFTGSTQDTNVFELGDKAILTANNGVPFGDDEGDGWLRLTSASESEKGYAFLNMSFPSTLGVLVEFDYQIWTNHDANQGDGFSVFLFDADKVSTEDFTIGGFGGSLGYANNEDTDGLSGGYIGVGFDVYGNFSNPSEGRVGGDGPEANRIVLRGPTTDDSENTNKFLTAVSPLEGSKINYEVQTNNRPTNNFYRRVRIVINATDDGNQEFKVLWKESVDDDFTELITYLADDTFPGELPENLKLGFAASTGSAYSFHEIRNIIATTPGNLRVEKSTDVNLLYAGNPESGDEFEYTIIVTNDTDSWLDDIEFTDVFSDGTGNPLPSNMIEITDIVLNDFPSSADFPSPTFETPLIGNSFSGILGLQANSYGTITISGRLLDVPNGYELRNTTEVYSNSILESDFSNNISTASIPVVAGETDLKVELIPEDYCFDSNGNKMNLKVSNLGEEAAEFEFNNNGKINNKIWIELEYPDNVTLDFSELNDNQWHLDDKFYDGNKILLLSKEEGIFPGKSSLSELPITITPDPQVTSYEIRVKLSYLMNEVPVEVNLHNNEHILRITTQVPPEVVAGDASELIFCIGEETSRLEAVANEGNELIWYDDPMMEVPLYVAPTPNAENAGVTTYYVTQTNGYCESEASEIKVIVLGPQAGEISAPLEICIGNMPLLTGSSLLPELVGVSVRYLWERSHDGVNWEETAVTETADYQTNQGIYEEVFFRRWVVYQYKDKSCTSVDSATISLMTKACQIMVNPALPLRIHN